MFKTIHSALTKLKSTNKYIITGFVLLVILAGLFYKAGYLPVVGKFIANEKIEQYQSEIYNSNDIANTKYYFKSGLYEPIDSESSIYGISYDLENNYISDDHQVALWNNQLIMDFENIITQMPEGVMLKSPFISGYIDGNDYSHKIQRLYLDIYNEEHLTVEESEKKAAEYTMKTIDLLGEKYNIIGVQIWYFDRNGGYNIAELDKRSPLSYEFLIKNTKKIDKLGENEQQWILELQ